MNAGAEPVPTAIRRRDACGGRRAVGQPAFFGQLPVLAKRRGRLIYAATTHVVFPNNLG